MLTQSPPQIASPPWQQLIYWIADPLGFQDRYSQQYGDIFTMQLGRMGAYVLVGNPQAVQEIFSQDAKFDVGRGNALAQPLIGENSLMLMDGKRHRRERKLLMPPFHGERLQTYGQQICQITHQFASQWPVEQPFVARTAMQAISLEMILQIVFGISEGERYQQLKPLLTEWLNMTDSPLRSSLLFLKFLQKDWGPWSPWGRMASRQRQVHRLLQAEIEDRRHQVSAERTDVLSLMMAARDEQGQAMDDAELRDELLTLLFAGHETTATMLAWALYQIHRHPRVRDRLRRELDSLGEQAAPMEMARLPYLSAICQEILRMYPVLPVLFPRIAKQPITLAGHRFEAETTFMVSIYLVHYQPPLYPDPHQFQPERFLQQEYAPHEYFPFGGGSRRCLGYAFALLEMKLILATLLSSYPLALAENKPVQAQRRGFTLAPAGGVKLMLKAADAPQSAEGVGMAAAGR